MTRPYRLPALLLLLAAVAPQLTGEDRVFTRPQAQAQTQPVSPDAQVPLRFEVVSIRPHRFTGDDPSNRQLLPGGRFVVTATTVRTLVRIALATDDDRMAGAPGWIDHDAFDIDAITADHAEVRTPEQFQQLILSLLVDRFQFKFHLDRKEGPVYWLELSKPGKTGLALKPAAADSKPNMSTNSRGLTTSMKVTNQSMADVAATLRRQAGRPVEDHTGLSGRYDFQIEWTPKDTPESTTPSLYAVLQEQLGVRLKPAKGTVETVVIDRLERPSDN